MTVLGAVVFGGLLALCVLRLLVTAPGSDVDRAWNQAHDSTAGADDFVGYRVLTSSAAN